MGGKIRLVLMAFIIMSCSKNGTDPAGGLDYDYGRQLSHDKIVLGERLENPYKTSNVTKALETLYPVKADRVQVAVTDLYVRFLPKSQEEYDMLESMGITMTDHPLDYEILKEGDWYHDPEVPEGTITWQYAVVPDDFKFPDMEYEIIDECHISSDADVRSDDGIDWEAVERQAYLMTGNADMLMPQTKASKVYPSGRITIVDEEYKDGLPLGVKGVKVSCNSFVKFAHAYTDEEGNYRMNKSFSAKLRYRLVFENSKGFDIGFNLLLVPASVSTLGRTSPDGVTMTVTEDSESKLYKRCVVNNAAYDYYSRCASEDLNLIPPPKNLRLWIFHRLKPSSAVMMHHGAVIDSDLVSSFLGDFAPLVKIFLPDITLGLHGQDKYSDIYATVCHELAHASHFAKVGTSYWNRYILYVLKSFVTSGGTAYGDGSGENSGYCEVGECWAYYLSSKMYHERYGGEYPVFGSSFWFYPQIFRYLEERGIGADEIFSVMNSNVTSRETLMRALLASNPGSATVIEQIFNRYQ